MAVCKRNKTPGSGSVFKLSHYQTPRPRPRSSYAALRLDEFFGEQLSFQGEIVAALEVALGNGGF